MFMPLKNISTTMCEDCGDFYYYSAEMLEKGFYIKLTYRKSDREKDKHLYDELIEIHHFKKDLEGELLLVKTYILRWDKPLSPIETYRLLKDLLELFWLYSVDSIEPCLAMLEEMAVHYMETTKDEEYMENFYYDLGLILKSYAVGK